MPMARERDRDGEVIRLGDRVRILCDDDRKFYNKMGVVTLIDENPPREDYNFFVEMVGSGGGQWWHGNYLRVEDRQNYFPPTKKSPIKHNFSKE